MSKVTLELIHALRRAAIKLETSAAYQWGHMGACNCGFLAQEVTQLTPAEIHKKAMASHGDWREQLNDYCPTSGLPMDDVISELINFGFDVDQLKHLERLSDPWVLQTLPEGTKLNFNSKSDVIIYMKHWANRLDEFLIENISLPQLGTPRRLEQKAEA